MKSKDRMRCYYCGSPAQSREHIPPKQMFKAFTCDSITVPSCDEHNTLKSSRDQAIVSALLLPLRTGRHRYPLEPDIDLAIKTAESSFERTKRSAVQTPFLKNPPPGLEDLPDLAYLSPSVNLESWVRQLSAGLVYDGIGPNSRTIRWSEAIVWSPDWFTAAEPKPIDHADAVRILEKTKEIQFALDSFSWNDGWSAYPRPYPRIIYLFHLHFASNRELIIRHRFYNRYSWYVIFTSSKRNIQKLQRKTAD